VRFPEVEQPVAKKSVKHSPKLNPPKARPEWQPRKEQFRVGGVGKPVSLPAIGMFQAEQKAADK
jgi:hypothetical protein